MCRCGLPKLSPILLNDAPDIYPTDGALVINRVTQDYQDAMQVHQETAAEYRDALRQLAR
jgi:hypothetical protein